MKRNTIEKKTQRKTPQELEDLLGAIQEKLYDAMSNDLDNPDKRSPQLYNAVIKELERNGIDCILKAGDDAENALNNLLVKVQNTYNEGDYDRDTIIN